MDSEQQATRLAKIILEKKGKDILILDLRETAAFTDFFVIATATSTVHARAIAEALRDSRAVGGLSPPNHIEGMDSAQWILLDCFDVIVHIFLPDVRGFYGLERLWGDVPQKAVKDE
ncbi:MAG: ribosome silencing factor [bacterium]